MIYGERASRSVVRINARSRRKMSRREFIEEFASRRGYDRDRLAEFLLDLESVDGIYINISGPELHVNCKPDGIHPVAIFYFSIAGDNEASLFMQSSRFFDELAEAGHLPAEAQDLFDFFMEYVYHSKTVPVPYGSSQNINYYADVGSVLADTQSFLDALQRFINVLSS